MEQKPTLIYVGDPMCSWCYGISKNIALIKEEYKDVLQFEIVMGGLRPYNKETMFDLKTFLTPHWESVHNASGQEFNYGILDSKDITYDTEPPSRAVVVFLELCPDLAFDFFQEVQYLFYVQNKNMHLSTTYKELLQKRGVSFEIFEQKFESKIYQQKTKEHFELANDLMVRSFPTLLLDHKGKKQMLLAGFDSIENIRQKIEKYLAK